MIIKVKVKVNASVSQVSSNDDVLVVSLKSKPLQGRANLELVKVLSKYFGVPAKSIKIKSGKSSRIKLVELDDKV